MLLASGITLSCYICTTYSCFKISIVTLSKTNISRCISVDRYIHIYIVGILILVWIRVDRVCIIAW
jgi:hypothetical protein